jgi:hypothetical protein
MQVKEKWEDEKRTEEKRRVESESELFPPSGLDPSQLPSAAS